MLSQKTYVVSTRLGTTLSRTICNDLDQAYDIAANLDLEYRSCAPHTVHEVGPALEKPVEYWAPCYQEDDEWLTYSKGIGDKALAEAGAVWLNAIGNGQRHFTVKQVRKTVPHGYWVCRDV